MFLSPEEVERRLKAMESNPAVIELPESLRSTYAMIVAMIKADERMREELRPPFREECCRCSCR